MSGAMYAHSSPVRGTTLKMVFTNGTYTTTPRRITEESAAYCIHLLLNTPIWNKDALSDLLVYARTIWQRDSVMKVMVRAASTEPNTVRPMWKANSDEKVM